MIPAEIRAIERPDPALLKLYILRAMVPFLGLAVSSCFVYGATLPIIALIFLPMYFRYHTLRYRFDDAGVAVSWGYFFRSETYLTFEKIQDIHLTRGLFERWLGIGTVAIQTASGSSEAEEALVGLREFDRVRDFLYSRMRVGLRSGTPESAGTALPAGGTASAAAPLAPTGTHGAADAAALLTVLKQIHEEVIALRQSIEAARRA